MNKKEKVTVSIIIVRYRVVKELFDCLDSLKKLNDKTPYEVILVDNDIQRPVEKEIQKKYTWVTYIKAPRNLGFGPGNNLGATYAKGKYLFFLNSDTRVLQGTLDALTDFLNLHKDAGIISPLLLDQNKNVYPSQGTRTLTPLNAIFAMSFIHKLFPNNPISRNYFMSSQDAVQVKKVDAIAGTAVMIRRTLFDAINGWDNKIFIYFEEFDICKRAKEKGCNIYIIPKAKIIHLWERSTRDENDFFMKVFRKSRFYYFKKHFGIVSAVLTEMMLRIGKYTFLVGGLLFAAAFLLLYQLPRYMSFIGDQGWFYLSARDMLLTGKVPLVGITSSHIWLHQGPLWTYILAGLLRISNFNPIFPGYVTAGVGIVTVFLIYFIGSRFYNKTVGFWAALLYGASPLVITEARMPYHTSFISLTSVLYFYSLSEWMKGKRKGFVASAFLLTILYNFELATAVLALPFILIAMYGVYKKTTWMKNILNLKTLVTGVIFFLLPLVPVIVYDTSHGYPQTLKFIIWLFYAAAKPVLKHIIAVSPTPPGPDFWTMTFLYLKETIFLPSSLLAGAFFILGVLLFLFTAYKNYRQHNVLILLMFFVTTLGAYIGMMTPSEAYLPMLIPFLFLGISVGVCSVKQKIIRFALYVCLFAVATTNIFYLLASNYAIGTGSGPTMQARIATVSKMLKKANGRPYSLEGKGPGSQFISFTMNYQYLAWYMGHPVSNKPQKLHFILREKGRHIILTSVLQ